MSGTKGRGRGKKNSPPSEKKRKLDDHPETETSKCMDIFAGYLVSIQFLTQKANDFPGWNELYWNTLKDVITFCECFGYCITPLHSISFLIFFLMKQTKNSLTSYPPEPKIQDCRIWSENAKQNKSADMPAEKIRERLRSMFSIFCFSWIISFLSLLFQVFLTKFPAPIGQEFLDKVECYVVEDDEDSGEEYTPNEPAQTLPLEQPKQIPISQQPHFWTLNLDNGIIMKIIRRSLGVFIFSHGWLSFRFAHQFRYPFSIQ